MFDFDQGTKRPNIFQQTEEGEVTIKMSPQDALDLLNLLLSSLSIFEESAKIMSRDEKELSIMIKNRYIMLADKAEHLYLKVSAQYSEGQPDSNDIIN